MMFLVFSANWKNITSTGLVCLSKMFLITFLFALKCSCFFDLFLFLHRNGVFFGMPKKADIIFA